MINGDSSIPPVAEVVVFNLSDRCRIFTEKVKSNSNLSTLSMSQDIAAGVFAYSGVKCSENI